MFSGGREDKQRAAESGVRRGVARRDAHLRLKGYTFPHGQGALLYFLDILMPCFRRRIFRGRQLPIHISSAIVTKPNGERALNVLINDFSKDERNGFVIVMGLLADRYPHHDTWEGLLAGGLKAIIFGTHSKSSGKQNRPSFAIYKKSGTSAPVFGLRFDDNTLRAEVAEKLGPDAYGIRFPLGEISENLSVLTYRLDLWAQIEGISNRMTGSSAVVVSDDGLAPEKKVWLEDELAWVKRRRGQAEFRERLMNIYGRTCALTGCSVEPVLQACHIISHSTGLNYASSNGLLMRSDLHLLFDAGLLRIDGDGIVYVQPSLKSDPSYQNLDSQSIHMPVLDKAGLELFKRTLAARFSEISR